VVHTYTQGGIPTVVHPGTYPGRLYPAYTTCYIPREAIPGIYTRLYTREAIHPCYTPGYTPGRLYTRVYTTLYTQGGIPPLYTRVYTMGDMLGMVHLGIYTGRHIGRQGASLNGVTPGIGRQESLLTVVTRV